MNDEIVTVGNWLTTTSTIGDVDEHPFEPVYVTEYGPEIVATILSDVDPFDHTTPEDSEDVRITESPAKRN